MDAEEQSIVEEYASSLEDLTFNSKPLINVLTMLAEENSRYAASVTKLIEERIYKVSQQHKLPSLYLLDSIIKNVGGIYLNLIAQVLVKVFVTVFGKADEKTRKDLYKLRHTWPQYFSAKILHDLDVNINKLDPGWPITAVPPPSPSIHVNPKFLKKAEATTPQIPTAVIPDVLKEDEKEVLVEHQKRRAELQRLQDAQLRLTEQEIQEHQLKRDLILRKQEQERKALLTQQQQLLLTLRLESELGGLADSTEKTSVQTVSTKAELTPATHSITSSRDPRLQRQEQAPSHNNNNGSQHQRNKDNAANHAQAVDPRVRDKASFSRNDRNIDRTDHLSVPNNKRRSRSQSPINEREKKIPRHDVPPKNKDIRPEPDKHHREERPPKRRRSLEGTENISDSNREFPIENRGYRGRVERGRGFRGRDRGRTNRPIRDDKGMHVRGPRTREEGLRTRVHPEGRTLPAVQSVDSAPEKVPNLIKPKPLLSDQEVMEIRSKDSGNEPENATIPQELTLEHKNVILEEAKRRLEAGDISQEQYIELIDKLAEFYELQRQQEQEAGNETLDRKAHDHNLVERSEVHGPPVSDPRNLNGRGGRANRIPRNRRPNEGNRQPPHRDGPLRNEGMDDPRRRDGPPRVNQPGGFEGPPRPSRLIRVEDQKRDHPLGRMEGLPNERERLPPHDHMQPHHMLIDGRHPPDQGLPGRFIPPNADERDFRGPGPHPRHFEEPHHQVEALTDGRGHPFGHGRPVEHFQAPLPGHHRPPLGPGHEIPPHVRTTQPGGPVQIVSMETRPSIRMEGPGHHPGEPGITPGLHPMELGPPPGHRPGEPGHHPGHQHGEPSHHPGLRPVEAGMHPGQHPGQPGLNPGHQPGLHPGHHPGEPGPQGLPHLQMRGEGSPHRQGSNTPPPSIPTNTPPTPSRMDKRTVDDLFSKLVQVGIIKVAEEPIINTPPRIDTPPVIMQQPLMNPHPIPSSSVAPPMAVQAPPISTPMTPMNLQRLQKMIEKSRAASTCIPKIGLNIHDLKKRHSGIINMLYKGTQCSSCGLRFDGEAEAFYREHLDWHFRRNRREKDGRRIAHRQWYIPLKDWLEYEEITDPEEKAHSSFFDAEKTDSDTNIPKTQGGDGSCPVLPGDTEAEMVCDICQEKFEQFWEETQEEWHYKEAIRVDGKTYHEMCYQDVKSNVEETATEANVDNSESEQESVKDPLQVKKETPKIKTEDGETTQSPVVKKEENLLVVKTEDGSHGETQCSESGKGNNEVLKQSEVAINEVKVKIEPIDSTDSEINTTENKGDTNAGGGDTNNTTDK